MAASNTSFLGAPPVHNKYLRTTSTVIAAKTGLAVGRTPVELWQRILELAIHSGSLYPVVADGFIQNIEVFGNECTIMSTYHASELARNRLRLVCQSWNFFLNQRSHSFVPIPMYTNSVPIPSEETLKTANRIQIIDRQFACICPTRCYLSHRWIIEGKRRLTPYYEWHYGLGDLVEQCGELSARVLRCDLGHSDVDSVARAFPNLKVLSSRAGGSSFALKVSNYFPSITHLDVDGNIRDTFRTGLGLPSLTTLSIRLLNHDASVYGHDWPMPGEWNLPSLQYLSIEGFFGRGFVRTHFDTLLRVCGLNLLGLSVIQANRRNVTSTGFAYPDNLWELCPNLSCLGGSAQSLLHAPPPTSPIQLETILLDSLFGPLGFEQANSIRETPDLVAACAIWAFQEFRLRTTWERFWLRLQSASIHERAEWINFLAQFGLFNGRHGRPLKDAEGIAFDEPRAAHIRQSIQMETSILSGRLKTTFYADKMSRMA